MLWSECTVVCVLTAVSTVTGQSVVVNTRYGALRGTRTTIGHDSYVDTFYNIPYAKPPVGNNEVFSSYKWQVSFVVTSSTYFWQLPNSQQKAETPLATLRIIITYGKTPIDNNIVFVLFLFCFLQMISLFYCVRQISNKFTFAIHNIFICKYLVCVVCKCIFTYSTLPLTTYTWTGYLRFHKPVVNEAWTGIRDATTPGPMCPQPSFTVSTNETYFGTEDCLYLNVHTPQVNFVGTFLWHQENLCRRSCMTPIRLVLAQWYDTNKTCVGTVV